MSLDIVIPAHDEADKLPRCLKAVVTAAACAPVPVLTVGQLGAALRLVDAPGAVP